MNLSWIIEEISACMNGIKNEVSTSQTRIRLVISNHHLSTTMTITYLYSSYPWSFTSLKSAVINRQLWMKREVSVTGFLGLKRIFHHKSQFIDSVPSAYHQRPGTPRELRTLRLALEARLQSARCPKIFLVWRWKKLRIQIYRHLDFCPSDGNSSIWFGRYHPRKKALWEK